MSIYITLYFSTALIFLGMSRFPSCSMKGKLTNEKLWLLFLCGILFLLQALRSVSVGGDLYDNYQYSYQYFGSMSWEQLLTYSGKSEIGYVVFNKIIYDITNGSLQLFLATLALIYIGAIYRFILLFSSNYFYSILVYLGLGLFNTSMNNLRSTLAIAVIILGLPYLKDKKYFAFIIHIFIATLFHTTVLSFLFFVTTLFIRDRKILISYYIGICMFFVVGFSVFGTLLVRYLPKYDEYINISVGKGYNYLIFLSAIALVIAVFSKSTYWEDDKMVYMFKMLICGICLQLISLRISFFVRAVNYHMISLMVLLPDFIDKSIIKGKMKNIVTLAILIGFALFYLIILIGDPSGTVPYIFFTN